jgi:hypothetical protein
MLITLRQQFNERRCLSTKMLNLCDWFCDVYILILNRTKLLIYENAESLWLILRCLYVNSEPDEVAYLRDADLFLNRTKLLIYENTESLLLILRCLYVHSEPNEVAYLCDADLFLNRTKLLIYAMLIYFWTGRSCLSTWF